MTHRIENACRECCLGQITALESALAEEKAKNAAPKAWDELTLKELAKVKEENATLRARVEELERQSDPIELHARIAAAEARVKELVNEQEQIFQDRDLWKRKYQLLDVRMAAFLAPVSDAEEREALAWAESNKCVCVYGGNEEYCRCKKDPRVKVLARALLQSRAKLAVLEKDRDAKQEAQWKANEETVKEMDALREKLAAVEKERDMWMRYAKLRQTNSANEYAALDAQIIRANEKLVALSQALERARGILREEQEGWDCGPGECHRAECRYHIIQRFLASLHPVAPKPGHGVGVNNPDVAPLTLHPGDMIEIDAVAPNPCEGCGDGMSPASLKGKIWEMTAENEGHWIPCPKCAPQEGN